MNKVKTFSNANVSLTPQIFYILLSLAIKERHGYEIMKQIEHDSNGRIKLGPGTLYGAVKRMLEEKLIIELDTQHARRKYYKLTEKGRTIFSHELERYNDAVELAKKRSLFVKPSVIKFAYA
ncbi:MAG TPA: PadR family transcriptional regulator [Patescibacteria group bacterium]|nr:PadR family transcriptional regulator [Patescibacteria group bacterium]